MGEPASAGGGGQQPRYDCLLDAMRRSLEPPEARAALGSNAEMRASLADWMVKNSACCAGWSAAEMEAMGRPGGSPLPAKISCQALAAALGIDVLLEVVSHGKATGQWTRLSPPIARQAAWSRRARAQRCMSLQLRLPLGAALVADR